MNIEQLNSICILLDLCGKKDHIFFMSEEEYKKEFDWLYPKDAICYGSVGNGSDKHPSSVSGFVFNGISFHVLDPNFKRMVV